MSAKINAPVDKPKNLLVHRVHFKNLEKIKRIYVNLAVEFMDKKHDILQPSDYDEGQVNYSSEVFADKKPIRTTGTTCDTFSARFESLHVFVKQLKPEFRSNPKFREAFRKEYEIGFPLNHSSLPRYIRFLNGDTIVIEFVDGKTLLDLIQTDDLWIHQDSNIETLVGQLLNVMDYLHRKNILHCDIKTDNIMITNETRNLMLLDLDKAFTASQDLTPGTPLNYGTNEEHLTKRQMDIRGVGKVIVALSRFVHSEKLNLRLSGLIAATRDSETTVPDLIEVWNKPLQDNIITKVQHRERYFIGFSLGAAILIAIIGIIWSKSYFDSTGDSTLVSLDKNKISEYVVQSQGTMGDNGLEEPLQNNANIKTEPQEDIKTEHTNLSDSEWVNIIKSELASLNSLINKIESDINENNISSPSQIGELMMKINDELSFFNQNVVTKLQAKNPSMSQQEILGKIYESAQVKDISARLDVLFPRMLEYQQTISNPEPIKSVEQLPVSVRERFEKQVEKDLTEYICFLKEIENGLKTNDKPPYGKYYISSKIINYDMTLGSKFMKYNEMFPEIRDIAFRDLAYTTDTWKELASLKDSVSALLKKRWS